MFFVPPAPRLAAAGPGPSRPRPDLSGRADVEQGNAYFAALKLLLVFGPLLGFAALELILLRRDKRRAAEGRPLVPVRTGAER